MQISESLAVDDLEDFSLMVPVDHLSDDISTVIWMIFIDGSLFDSESMMREVVEPDVMVSIITPDLVLKSFVLEHNEVLVESFEQTFGWVLSGQESLSLTVVIPELENSFWVVEGFVFQEGVKMDVVHTSSSGSIFVDWVYLKYHF
mgnify:CR=1 FL=1